MMTYMIMWQNDQNTTLPSSIKDVDKKAIHKFVNNTAIGLQEKQFIQKRACLLDLSLFF